jgi:hypothetical protein
MKTVIGLFDSIADAQGARDDLIGSGIENDRISIVTRPANDAMFPNDPTEAAEGAGIGATAGAIAGGAAGLLASLGQLMIPGIGPLLAAGSIVAILTGAGIGAATGGIIGALIGLGIPHREAEIYAEGIKRGGTLLSVDSTDNDADRIAAVMSQHDAVDIEKRALEWEAAGWQREQPDNRDQAKEADKAKEAKAIEALQSGKIGGPEVTPSTRGVDRADVSNTGASVGSIGVGMGEGIGDTAGTRRRNARIYNPK